MTTAEQMTRSAAWLIGRDVTGYRWRSDKLAMVKVEHDAHPGRDDPIVAAFAPLTDPSDAFMVEVCIPISVRCEYRDGRLAMYATTPRPGLEDLGYMTTARADLVSDVLVARMRLVTQFAELVNLAEQCDA